MTYRIDVFFDEHLVPLIEARRVRFTFTKDLHHTFAVRSLPLNPSINPEIAKHYSFSLIQTEGYASSLSASYYLLSMPRESIPSVRVEEIPELLSSGPFMVIYDPQTQLYEVMNHFNPASGSQRFASFSQVLGTISKRWYFVNVEHKELSEVFPRDMLSRKAEGELFALVSHPQYQLFIGLCRKMLEELGSSLYLDFSVNDGVINLIVPRRQVDATRASEVYREYSNSLGESLSQVFFRNVFLIFV